MDLFTRDFNILQLSWWKKHHEKFVYPKKYGYNNNEPAVLSPSIKYDLNRDAEVLWIGFNPGGNCKNVNQELIDAILDEDVETIHERDEYIAAAAEELIHTKGDENGKGMHEYYFKPLKEMTAELYGGIGEVEALKKYEHIDLFCARGTSSKVVKQWLGIHKLPYDQQKGMRIQEEHRELLKETMKTVIEGMENLKVILFNSVVSSQLVYDEYSSGHNTDFELGFDTASNLHYLQNKNGDQSKIYVYFQGMMGFGRLDKFAKERLIGLVSPVLRGK
jgi:hypothetical protein